MRILYFCNTFMKGLLIFILLLQVNAAYSQVIYYTYDAAGNRIGRASSQAIQTRRAQNNATEKTAVSMLDDTHVSIYPNPTEGDLHVEILGIGEEDTYSISLYNAAGQRLFYKGRASTTTQLDIRKQPAGSYFLHIAKDNEQEKTSKIIKK